MLGAKNRIYLGVITAHILHFYRNVFRKNALYITKHKYNKIIIKHQEIKPILINNFQHLINNTFASCEYNKNGLYNFISIVDNKYIIYAISSNNFYTEIATCFYAKKNLLKKCNATIIFFNEKDKKDFFEYLTN